MSVSMRDWWDDICTRCGACCYRRDRVDDQLVIHQDKPCRFLDTETNLCTTYTSRFQKCGECRQVTFVHALFSRYLPDDCGYVEKFRFWRRDRSKDHDSK